AGITRRMRSSEALSFEVLMGDRSLAIGSRISGAAGVRLEYGRGSVTKVNPISEINNCESPGWREHRRVYAASPSHLHLGISAQFEVKLARSTTFSAGTSGAKIHPGDVRVRRGW